MASPSGTPASNDSGLKWGFCFLAYQGYRQKITSCLGGKEAPIMMRITMNTANSTLFLPFAMFMNSFRELVKKKPRKVFMGRLLATMRRLSQLKTEGAGPTSASAP